MGAPYVVGTPINKASAGAGSDPLTDNLTVPADADGVVVCLYKTAFASVVAVKLGGAGGTPLTLQGSFADASRQVDIWTLAAPPTGVQQVYVDYSAASRGGFTAFAVKDFGGIGAVATFAGNSVALAGVLDRALVVAAFCCSSGDTTGAPARYPFGQQLGNFIGAPGAGANSLRCVCNVQRGYPAAPMVLGNNFPNIGAMVALELR